MKLALTLLAGATFLASPLAYASSTDSATDRGPPEQKASSMTPTEIKAFNEGLAATHPYYIKCRKRLEIGSLVKKVRVCHTNEEWKKVTAIANQDARDTAESMTSKAANSN